MSFILNCIFLVIFITIGAIHVWSMDEKVIRGYAIGWVYGSVSVLQ